jgi:hypothetical protein
MWRGIVLASLALCSGLKTIDLGLSELDGRVVALGDFNGDRKMDVVLLNTQQTELSILLWTQSTLHS